ncbi:MAG: ATP-binding protein [Candidatus Viridilinea halotolerans]|uniref:ATP-binding protein n=1 Tax=Candidatus Viridilinea halotolerans TaxID=2491704 RepID=A0A426U3N4_9CHLR|nr:MAG: ATP-binding protein [Candidatus Viridilinea halotolerans]
MFINRTQELTFLSSLLTRERPGPGQLVLLYGRRRVGKTALLRHWATQCGVAATYWVAERELPTYQRRRFYARLLGVPLEQAPIFATWPDLWQALALHLEGQAHIIMLDELPYAVEADPTLLSALQHAWDHHFQHSQVRIILCGSQVHAMETLLTGSSPLFGRMTGQWLLRPLPFAALSAFLPAWSAEELVATYAIVGGIPAYLEWLQPERGLVGNLRDLMLAPGSMFLAEPTLILSDEIRDPRVHRTIVQAIGRGAHTLSAISDACFVSKTHLPAYLQRLQELRLVERRLPATVPLAAQQSSRQGRYHLSDPFFRFYFRFIAPMQDDLNYQPERVLPGIQQGLRAFVGQTAWEELARSWVRRAGTTGELPWRPQVVGSHWSRAVQVDVVAIDWQNRQMLLGECTWGDDVVSRSVVRELIDTKTPLVLADLPQGGKGWSVTHAIFARAGLTPAAQQELAAHSGIAVDLPRLMDDLAHEEGG